MDALYESGCDDALLGLRQQGRIALEFCREAASADEAILSAIRDVKSAIADAVLIEVTPDLVGVSDVAEIRGCSRQYMRKVIQKNSVSFPVPVHEGVAALWHLSPVLQWFERVQNKPVDALLMELSFTAMKFNVVKEMQALQLDADIYDEMLTLIG